MRGLSASRRLPESQQGPLEFGLRLSRGLQRADESFVVDAHRDDGKRFIVRADDKLTAFAELESQLAVKGTAF